MKQIPLNKIPNQEIAVSIDDVVYNISIQQGTPNMFISFSANEEELARSIPLVPKQPLLPKSKTKGGNFYMASLVDYYPKYEEFDENFALLYVGDDE